MARQSRSVTSTASGLSLGNISVGFGNNGSNFLDFDRGAFSSGPPTAIAADQGFVSGILSWERWTGTSTASGTVYGCTNNCGTSTPYSLSSSQGIHVIDGVLATNLPTTNVTVIYNLVGGTSPTIADGCRWRRNIAEQQPSRGQVRREPIVRRQSQCQHQQQQFQYPKLRRRRVTLAVRGGSCRQSNLQQFDILHHDDDPWWGGHYRLHKTCNASINGFLAGNGASHLGILYQFNTANSAKMVSGAAGFAK